MIFLINHNGAAIDAYWSNWDACNIGAILTIGVLPTIRRSIMRRSLIMKPGRETEALCMPLTLCIIPAPSAKSRNPAATRNTPNSPWDCLPRFARWLGTKGWTYMDMPITDLLAGAEYVAQTNLSKPVPYTYYTNSDQANQYYISINGIGRLDDRPIWEMIYNHYVVLEGLSAPNVQAMAQLMRPEHGSADHFGYGTLTFTLQRRRFALSAFAYRPRANGLDGHSLLSAA